MTAQWQPIETAPKDGTDALLYLPKADRSSGQGRALRRQRCDQVGLLVLLFWRGQVATGVATSPVTAASTPLIVTEAPTRDRTVAA